MGKRANGEGSIYKTDKGWRGCAVIGHDTNGKPVRKYVSGKTRAIAKARLDEVMANAKNGIQYLDAGAVTVSAWLTRWLDVYIKPHKQPRTIDSYTFIVKSRIMPRIGTIKLSKLSGHNVQEMINDILANGLSARSARYALTVLRMAIKQAIKERLICYDATTSTTQPRLPQKQIKQLTADEWSRLFKYAALSSEELYIMLLVVWSTGCRAGELLAIRICDVSDGSVTICQAISSSGGKLTISPTKTRGSVRRVSVPESVILKINDFVQANRGSAKYDELLFVRADGRAHNPSTLSHQFKQIADMAGVKTTLHGLRHDHATRLFAGGWHAKDVSDRLGHSTITITLDTYTHHVPQRSNDIAAWLGDSMPNDYIN